MPQDSPIADTPWLKQLYDELHANHNRGQLAHALLLAGPQGVGKHALASALARVFMCVSPNPTKPCGQCPGCTLAASGNHPDILVIKPEENKRTLGIEAIRHIIDRLAIKSHQGSYRTVIFPELENTTFAAANALLKLLEEPPDNTFFLCCTAQPGLLIPTIRSRLQIYQVRPPSSSVALGWLQRTHRIDRLEAEKYLTLAQGAPLQIVKMLQEDFTQQRQLMLNLLMMCHDGMDNSLQTVIRHLCAFPLSDNLKLITACLYDLLVLHYNPQTEQQTLHFCDKSALFGDWSKDIQPRHLFIVYNQLLAMQDACAKGIAVNQQLQLFNLAILLRMLLRSKGRQAN